MTDRHTADITANTTPIQGAVNKAARAVNWTTKDYSIYRFDGLLPDFASAMSAAAEYCKKWGFDDAEKGFCEAERIVSGNDIMTDDALSVINEIAAYGVTDKDDRATLAAVYCVAAAGIVANALEDEDNKKGAVK